MSDASGVLFPVNDPAPETPATETIRCPHCEAELRNARAEPGQALRCLNCGKRFVPVAAEDVTSAPSTAPEIPKRMGRDIRTPGYWLLRIPAILFCIIGVFITAMIFYNYFERRGAIRFRDLAFLAYVPLLSIGGFALLWLTKSLAELDNGLSRFLERRSPGEAELPPLSGSSLPYILPLAVIGGIMPIAAVGMNERVDEIIAFGIWGAALFLIAFALDDARQFLWRQGELIARVLKTPQAEGRINPSTLSTGFATLILALLILLCFERISMHEKPIFIFGLFCLIGGVISFGRLDNQFSKVAAAWRGNDTLAPEPFVLSSRLFWYGGLCGAALFGFCAYEAGKQFENDFNLGAQVTVTMLFTSVGSGLAAFFVYYRISKPARALPWRSRLLALIPVSWAMFGTTFFLTLWTTNTRSTIRISELSAGLFAGEAAFFAALWVGDFLVRWMVWRRDMQRALGVSDEAVSLRNYQRRFILGTVGLVVVQFVSISLEFLNNSGLNFNRLEELFLIPLALGLFHYPTLWFLALLNEMWRGHATLNADLPQEEEA